MPLYRIEVFGEGRAPWRATAAEAMTDAVRLQLASWDSEAREHFLAVPVDMAVDWEATEPFVGIPEMR